MVEIECNAPKGESMLKKSKALLAALAVITLWGLLFPAPARADQWHTSTYLTNWWSNLQVSVISEGCRDMACLNGRGLRLESGAGSIFNLYDLSTGGSEIRWGSGRKCLDVSGFGTANGTPVVLWDCHGGQNQLWTIQAFYGAGTDAGAILLVSQQSGKCLDARNPSFPTPPPPGAVLQIWDCVQGHGSAVGPFRADPFIVNQEWRFAF